MAIVSPEVRFSPMEKELLRLLGELLAGATSETGSNLPPDHAVLSDRESKELLALLEELSLSRRYVEGSFFIEQLTRVDVAGDDLREIYLSWRKRHGRSRVMSSTHWTDFLLRLGFIRQRRSYSVYPARMSREMDIQHFLKMEKILLSQPGIGPRVRNVIMSLVQKYADEVDASRRGDNPLPEGSIGGLPRAISTAIKKNLSSPVAASSISASQVAGLMTVVADTSVLFSTRDWGVAGTMSSIAGGLAAATYR